MKRKTLLLTLVGALVFFSAFKVVDKFFEIQKNLDIFTTLFREVNMYYVDEVNPNTLMKTGIESMLNSLDPYTNYIPEDDIEDYRTMHTGQYGGIGATVSTREGKSTIIMPYDGYPAHEAGLKIGDEIIKIDGIELKDKTNAQVSKLLKGLEVRSYGQVTTHEVTITRETIKIENVPYYGMVSQEVGYLQLTDFTNGASREVREAVEKLKEEGAKKIIIDLRGNPGGLLNEAVNICNLFINRDLEVVSTKGKIAEWNKSYKALNQPLDIDIPIAVLVNGRSASAAEIVSGVIQDYDRGVLIGQRSFGKGLVQTTRPLTYNSQLKVTTAKYYIPSGRCIQAIDYSKRKEDGSVIRNADSLKRAFKTKKSGRTVYDGVGLDPDIMMDAKKYAPITNSLRMKNLIFEYANEFALNHNTIAEAKKFSMSEADYQAFVKWLRTKEYDYTTEVEKTIKMLEEKAKDEKSYSVIEAQLKALKEKASHNKEAELQQFKAEIKELLEAEIVARYYLDKGQTEYNLQQDVEIKQAIEILSNMDKYNKILKGQK
ncbi:MAG: PDZ domain-containing protein [Bacteroidetes bacterium]|nr:MAG: PDZ domain-containing protein [Bacteroidota bacterium]